MKYDRCLFLHTTSPNLSESTEEEPGAEGVKLVHNNKNNHNI